MNGVIIYKSKYGSTEQYARWLGNETGLPVYSVKHVASSAIRGSGLVVLASNIRIGKLTLAGWIRKHWPMLKARKLVILSVSAAPGSDPSVKEAWVRSLPQEVRAASTHFALQGRLIFDGLDLLDKLLMSVASKMQGDPAVAENLRKGIDGVDKAQLQPVVEHIRTLTA